MKIKHFLFLAIGTVLTIALTLAGCGLAAPVSETGSIFLSLNDSYARALLPPIDLDIDHYIVSGAGPEGATTGPVNLAGSAEINDMVPGLWTITVVGRNAGGTPIGEGSDSIVVVVGLTTPLSITVYEFDVVPGSVRISAAWEPSTVVDPVWAGTLKDSSGTPTVMSFITDEPSCTTESTTDPAAVGWHTMIVQLYDAPNGLDGSETLSSGRAEAVRVASGFETYASLWFHAVAGQGTIDLIIDADMHDEIPLTGTPAFSDTSTLGLPPNDEATWVNVYVDDIVNFDVSAPEAVTNVYYLQGEVVAIDPVSGYDLDAGPLTVGQYYLLDCIAFSIDGRRASSGSWIVRKNDTAPSQFIASGTYFPSTNDYNVYLLLLDGALAVVQQQVITAGAINGNEANPFTLPQAIGGDYYLLSFQDEDASGTFSTGDRYTFFDLAVGPAPSGLENVTLPHVLGTTYDITIMSTTY